jgi:transposase
MQDTELYRHLLGIEAPWKVARVALNAKEQRVDVWAEHAPGTLWQCPECGEAAEPLRVYDHAAERSWRHLDSCQFMTYLHARPPRVECPQHGVKQARLPWAEPRARFTALFERFAIDVLLEADVLGATRILRISWDEAWHILERAVARGRAIKGKKIVARIGVDEKAAAKGHQYLTLVSDLDRGTIEFIADDRKTSSLDAFFVSLTDEQRAGIQAVAMDMWEPFQASTYAHVADAEHKIVFDRFHVMQHVGRAVDTVRKAEHRALSAQGDNTLARSKYLWLYAEENVPEKAKARFEELRSADLATGRAWSIKETLRHLWNQPDLATATAHWKRWFFWATHCRLAPIIQAARTVKRHVENVLTYFTHRITNAVSEGLNSKIQTIKKRAYGFRNKDNFKTAIYFHCGGLELYPARVGTGAPHTDPG